MKAKWSVCHRTQCSSCPVLEPTVSWQQHRDHLIRSQLEFTCKESGFRSCSWDWRYAFPFATAIHRTDWDGGFPSRRQQLCRPMQPNPRWWWLEQPPRWCPLQHQSSCPTNNVERTQVAQRPRKFLHFFFPFQGIASAYDRLPLDNSIARMYHLLVYGGSIASVPKQKHNGLREMFNNSLILTF